MVALTKKNTIIGVAVAIVIFVIGFFALMTVLWLTFGSGDSEFQDLVDTVNAKL